MPLKVGIQLYSVRKKMQNNPLITIKKLGEIGYKYLEFANHSFKSNSGIGWEVNVKDLKMILDEYRMNVVNCHIADVDMSNNEFQLNKINIDDLKRGIDFHKQIGNNLFTLGIDFFENNRDQILKNCEYYNKLGEICKKYEAKFLYHNHFQEFVDFENETIMDIIVKNTDPELVNFEFDTFWSVRGNMNPVVEFKKYGERILLIHQKDFSGETNTPINGWSLIGNDLKNSDKAIRPVNIGDLLKFPPEDFVEIGTGILPIQKYIDAALEFTKAKYIILEQDHTKFEDELESVKISMNSFKKFNGLKWTGCNF